MSGALPTALRGSAKLKYIKDLDFSSLACIDMHYFCSLIGFSIHFRNTVFLVSILEKRHYKLSMNSCVHYFVGLSYSILLVFSCKVKQQYCKKGFLTSLVFPQILHFIVTSCEARYIRKISSEVIFLFSIIYFCCFILFGAYNFLQNVT